MDPERHSKGVAMNLDFPKLELLELVQSLGQCDLVFGTSAHGNNRVALSFPGQEYLF